MRRLLLALSLLVGLLLMFAQVSGGAPIGDAMLSASAFGTYVLVGGLIILRRDGHTTGWLLVILGSLLLFADASLYLPAIPDVTVAWINSWVWTAMFALFATLTLTFPSGRPPQGDRPTARLGRSVLVALPFLTAATLFTETLGGPEGTAATPNPVGFLPGWLAYPCLLAVVVIFLGGAVSLVLKRRHATGAMRAQITWVVFGLALVVTSVALTFVYIAVSIAVGAGDPGDEVWSLAWLTMIIFPIWFGIAILRYKLFEIDRIVSRTVSYSVVVALLAALFAAAVTFVGSWLEPDNSLLVAASTLLVAGLFNPLRRRVQGIVDRRFNRSQYDAGRVGSAFAERVRDEVDPSEIIGQWVGVVSETLEPATVSVWVRARGRDDLR
jgi:hypothetical protein